MNEYQFGPFKKIPTREFCACCHKFSAVGFHVPNEIWLAAVPHAMDNDLLCIACFADFADAHLLPWDRHITFFPNSLVEHYSQALGIEFDRKAVEL